MKAIRIYQQVKLAPNIVKTNGKVSETRTIFFIGWLLTWVAGWRGVKYIIKNPEG